MSSERLLVDHVADVGDLDGVLQLVSDHGDRTEERQVGIDEDEHDPCPVGLAHDLQVTPYPDLRDAAVKDVHEEL